MIVVRDCRRCGHQDYNHAERECSYSWCRKHCRSSSADYYDERQAPTFDRYGKRQPDTVRIVIRTR